MQQGNILLVFHHATSDTRPATVMATIAHNSLDEEGTSWKSINSSAFDPERQRAPEFLARPVGLATFLVAEASQNAVIRMLMYQRRRGTKGKRWWGSHVGCLIGVCPNVVPRMRGKGARLLARGGV